LKGLSGKKGGEEAKESKESTKPRLGSLQRGTEEERECRDGSKGVLLGRAARRARTRG
jgi:hypothetical protein